MAFPDEDLDIVIKAYLGADPTADSATWPDPVDLSNRLLGNDITIAMGRRQNQQTAAAGQATFTLTNGAIGDGLGENAAGVLTPLNPSSPYYGTWDLGVPIYIAVGSDRRFSGYLVDAFVDVLPSSDGDPVQVVRVTLGGLLRRLGQGAEILSPLSRVGRSFRGSAVLPDWWPCEAGDGPITSTPSGITGGAPALVTNAPDGQAVTVISPDGLHGAAGALDLSGGATLRGDLNYGNIPADGSWSFECALRISSQALEDRITINAPDGSRYLSLLTLGTETVGFALTVDGTTNNLTGTAKIADGKWHWVSIFVDAATFGVSTPTVTVRVDGTVVTMTGSITVVAKEAAQFRILGVDAVSQIFHRRHADPGTAESGAAFGYDGVDTARARIQRLCEQNDIPFSFDVSASSAPLGPQETDTLLSIFASAEAADRGLLRERIDTWGLSYVTPSERVNLDPALTINLSTYRVTRGDNGVLQPVRNDQRIRNRWTVDTYDGTTATEDDEDHIARHGLYDDSVTLNLTSSPGASGTFVGPRNAAGWLVHEGTYEGMRQRQMPLDLAANTGLISDWVAMFIGQRIDRTNHPDGFYPDGEQLILEGYTERLAPRAWSAGLVGEPYMPWQVNVMANDDPAFDSPIVGWLEFGSCELASDVDADDTSWSVTCSPADTSDTDDFPRRHFIDGELVTVTASTGGTSPTWTVTRSGNGIKKAHGSGAAIVLADPLIFALT